MTHAATTLILGWGDPGRLDDGLGPACVEAVSELSLPDVVLDADYQLTMEDAAEVARFERVVFVDADRRGPAPFWMRRLSPSRESSSFSTHSVAPGAVLSLCRDLFGAEPESWLLGIRGYDFDAFGEGLSARARDNLDQAVQFLRSAVETARFQEFPAPAGVSTHESEKRECDRCPTPSE